MIRPATLDDTDWLIDLAKESGEEFLEDEVRAWFEQLAAAADPNVLFLRGDYGAVIACCQRLTFQPKAPAVHVLYLMLKKGGRQRAAVEGYQLAAAVIEWAKSLGASFHMAAQCGADLEPIAKRLGAVQDLPSWTVEA